MTFTLKDYNELSRNLHQGIQKLLDRDGKKTAEDLEPPRRNQVKFLQYLSTKLGIAIQRNTTHAPNAYLVLYGAMSLTSTMIADQLTFIHRHSLLMDGLNAAMGITDKEKPSTLQYKDMYSKLNKFLKHIFSTRDSSQGISSNTGVPFVDLDALEGMMHKGYELEEFYQNAALNDYTLNDNPADPFRTEKIPADALELAVAPLQSWVELNNAMIELCDTELQDKCVASIHELSKNRAFQLNFLHTIADALKAIPLGHMTKAERTAILAGAMHLVREQIGQIEYQASPLSADSISRSVIHTGLTKLLGAKTTSPQHIETLVQMTTKFMISMTTESQKNKVDHVFSKIKDFSLAALVELAQKIIKTCRSVELSAEVSGSKAVRKAIEEKAKSQNQPTPPASTITGMLGSLFFGTSTTNPIAAVAKEKDTEEVREVATVSSAP
jgi:hypothetical protein